MINYPQTSHFHMVEREMVERDMLGCRLSVFGHPIREQVDVTPPIGQVTFQSCKVGHDDVPNGQVTKGTTKQITEPPY